MADAQYRARGVAVRRRGSPRTIAVLSTTAFLALLGFQFERMASGHDPVLKTVGTSTGSHGSASGSTASSSTSAAGPDAYTPAQSSTPETRSS